MATPKEQAKRIKDLEKEIDKMDRIATLQDIVIERAKADNSADAENIKYQKGVIIKLRAEKYSQTEKIEDLTAMINSPNFNLETNTELKNVIDGKKSMLTSLRRHISSYKEDIKHQWSVIDTQEKEIKAKDLKLYDQKLQISTHERAIVFQAEELFKLRAKVSEQKVMIESRDITIKGFQQDVDNLYTTLKNKDTAIKCLEENKAKGSESVRIKALQQEVDRLSGKLYDANIASAGREHKLEQQYKTILKLTNELKPKCSRCTCCHHCGAQKIQTCW